MTERDEQTNRSICIFCGASSGDSLDYAAEATRFVAALVESGHRIIVGGGRAGIMGVVADTVVERGGTVVGVISEHLLASEGTHPGLSELHVTADIADRKRLMIELSTGFAALPGGLGTLDELSDVITGVQLGLYDKPCGLLNVNGYFRHLLTFLDHAVESGFVRPAARESLIVESDPQRLAVRLTR